MARLHSLRPNSVRALNWVAVLIWMGVIFLFSSDYFSAANTTPFIVPILSDLFPDLTAHHIENIISIIRKLGHVSEYFLLAILLMRALKGQFIGQPAKRRIVWSISLAVIYAVSDELHQAFVPSRTASLVDVMIDSFGGIIGSLGFHLRNRDNRSRPT